MSRDRDSQRRKFWKAFSEAFGKITDDCNTWELLLKRMTRSKRFGTKKLAILIAKSNTFKGHVEGSIFQLHVPLKPRRIDLLKWYAHAIQPAGTAWHGREYCKILLALIERFYDHEHADALKKSFIKNGVKYKAKRQLSERTKEKLTERLAVARAKNSESEFMRELKGIED